MKYISTARKPVESIFKNVRQELVSKYNGQQVPWEHTSLVGDFYINPDNIYNNFHYQEFAYMDSLYDSSKNELIDLVIEKLKTSNWYTQAEGIKQIVKLDFESESASKLFVLGRNIYQAACGECYDAIDFINSFGESIINIQAKIHILNGMAYEIYFDSKGKTRKKFKIKKYYPVICLLEKQEYYSCQNFIASKVSLISNTQYIYIPGSGRIFTLEIIFNDINDNLLQYLLLDGVIIYNSEDHEDSNNYYVPYSRLVEIIYEKLVIPYTNIIILPNIKNIKNDDYICMSMNIEFIKS